MRLPHIKMMYCLPTVRSTEMPFPAYTPNMCKLGEAWCLNVFHHMTEGTQSLDLVKFVSQLTFEQGDCLVGPEQLQASSTV